MTISITREDIENGCRCDPDCCPVGRALSRSGIDHLGVVGSGVMIIDERHYTEVVPLPLAVKDWILAFDGSRPVQPITFELAVRSKRKDKRRPPPHRAPPAGAPVCRPANGQSLDVAPQMRGP